jgi:proton-translocating NADH-quinone oxidoreductase chain M
LGSAFIFLSALTIFFNKGSSSFDVFLNSSFFETRQFFLWVFFFIGFSVKIPVMPLHIWLPEAHVEAPTPGSVILAGILLKLGSYAMLRLLLLPFFNVSFDLIFFVLTLSLFSFTYASLVALNQIDLKKIIAYSSVAHMNFSLIGLFSQTLLGLSGAFFMMFGHALTSSALFFGIGVIYDRYKSRLIFYYSSLATLMPFFSVLYFIFLLSNFGFPGTSNFVGEFFILNGGFFISNVIILLSSVGLILSLIYSLFLYNRIFFGLSPLFIRYFSDCGRREFLGLLLLFFLIVICGLAPELLLSFSYGSLKKLILLIFNF